MTAIALLVLAGVVVAGGVVAGITVAVARSRRRRNRVVPDVATNAPAAWAGAHTPLARLHRRLRAAVEAARAVPDPDGALIRARVEVEQSALAVDDHLVALHGMSERERAARMAQATAAVAAVEEGAARLADAATSAPTAVLPAVEEALERAALVEEARRELDAGPSAIIDDERVDGRLPDVAATADEPPDEVPGEETDDDGRGQPRPSTG